MVFICCLLLVAGPAAVQAQGTLEDYQRAEAFLSTNVGDLVLNESVNPNWIDDSDRFWYRRELNDGKEFLLIDARENTRSRAFDHARMAGALSDLTDETHSAEDLPFNYFEFVDEESAIRLRVDGTRLECDLTAYRCEEIEEEERRENGESPDGRWVAFTEDHNLFVRNTENGEVLQLTSDGEENYDYATPQASPIAMVEQGTQDVDLPVHVRWSPESDKLVTYRLDQRSANRFALIQSTPEDQLRPRHFEYAYPLPGEVGVAVSKPVVFDIERRTKTFLDVDPIPVLFTGGGALFNWYDDNERLYYLNRPRGYRSVQFLQVDAATGESRVLVEEQSDTNVDTAMSSARVINEGAEIIWTSEQRDGWHHLYLLDGETGAVRNQITQGEWVVRDIVRIDEDDRQIYFTASGRETDRDPYLRHFYRVNFDGSGLSLLTPEAAEHSVDLSPTAEFFVDTSSRPDQVPVSLLRSTNDGSVIRELEEANIEQLLATGWNYPEPFEAVAADGETDIYGIIWKPSNFDPSQQYPVIEQIYTGPHSFFVPKTFGAYRNHAQSIAELGFVVVMVDGRGTGRRSREFRDYSYQNLGRNDIEDHKAAIRQIAEERPYMDLSRVGIYGHSAGGYDSAHALLRHPDFYDVAVSSAGNHDHRLDKAWWNELWMGYPLGEHYHEQSNVTLADQLEGKLLLVHGELDNNVHPAATMQLVNALIQANKDFDMLIIPNRYHGLGGDPYFLRTRWDYFVRHLHGVEPPREYQITAFD